MTRSVATCLVIYAAFAAQSSIAQVPVVESYGTAAGSASDDRGPAAASASATGASGSSRSNTRELFQLLQALQIEVQELRGLVEEQRHQLNRLAREQKEQYLDIDRRLTAGSAGSGGGLDSGVAGTSSGSTSL